MAKKIVTLYICDTSLQLMVTDGKRIKQWADLPLEPGLIQNSVVIKEAEVTAKIKQLFKSLRVKTKKIVVGMSGLHCLTRPITLPRLPKAMLDEAVQREAERTLPVPLEQLYISWQTIPVPEEKTQVFLVTIPRSTADALLTTLHQTGLKPSFMDIKPLLLARVVEEETAIIVDVQITEFDIVIMVDGIPQPIRTVPFPNTALSWQEKSPMIRSELDRTITFYNSNNPENPLASSVPIFASGDLANESELCQVLSDAVGHPVLSLSSPLDYPQGFDPSLHMANIGLALQKLTSRKKTRPSAVNLNTLPIDYQPKPISLINVLGLPGAVIVVGLLVVWIMLIQSVSADIFSIRTTLNTTDQLLQQTLSQRKELTGNIAELDKKISEVQASRERFIAALDSLGKQSTGVNHDLEVTIFKVPSTVSLSSVNHNNSTLTISGRAPSEQGVLSYLLMLDTSGRFGDIAIANMTRIEGDGMEFTLIGTLQTENDSVSFIEVAVLSLPTTISLTSMSTSNGILTIDGRSLNEDDVLSYLQSLEASGRFREVNITAMTRIEDGGMEFSLVLKTGE